MSWLHGYWKLEEEISTNEWDLKKSQLELKRWESNGDLFNRNKFETALENQIRLNKSIQSLEGLLKEKKQLVQELLDRIDTFKGLDNKILKMKYVELMTLETIAYDLGYSTSYIYKKHAEIMRTMKFVERLM